jgi:hypothetical protein
MNEEVTPHVKTPTVKYNVRFELTNGHNVMYYDVKFGDRIPIPDTATDVSIWLGVE